MELKELQYLIAIAEEKSISKAAERLFMAQSSLSQALQTMETTLGGKLFIRTSTGVRLTEAGRLAVRYARKFLLEYHELQSRVADIENLQSGHIDFGVSTFRGGFLLPHVLTAFHQKYPQIQVEIHEANSMALEQLLIDGKVDIALVGLPLSKLKSEIRLLTKDEIVLVTSTDHPVAARAVHGQRRGREYAYLNLADTMDFEYILSDYDTMLGALGRKQFAAAGLVPKVCHSNLTAPLAAAMARAGMGLAFTYGSCRSSHPDGGYYSIGPEGVYLQLALASPAGRYRSKATIALEHHLMHSLGANEYFEV